MDNPDAIIIGAGPAGLATATSLQAKGLRAVILDKAGAENTIKNQESRGCDGYIAPGEFAVGPTIKRPA